MSDGAELRLSKSSIDLWFECAYAWYLAYVRRVPGEPSVHMAVGKIFHAGIEAHWKGEDALGATLAAAEAAWASMPGLDAEGRATALADAQGLLSTYLAKIAPKFTPSLVEARFLIRVDGVLVSGTIDAADDDVHDTKSTSTPSKVDPKRHEVEMTIYRHGFRALTGRLPQRLILDVVGRNGRAAQKEVQPDDQGMADVIGLAAKGIMSGAFPPTGVRTGTCVRCPYLEKECPYGRV